MRPRPTAWAPPDSSPWRILTMSTHFRLAPLRLTLLILLSFAFAVPGGAEARQAAAGDAGQGRTVEEIRIEGNSRIPDDTISFYLATRAGQPLDLEVAGLDYMALYNTGWFDNLVVRWEEGSAGGVVLIVEVDEKPVLREIRIEGTDKVEVDDFLERLELVDRAIQLNEAVDEQELRQAIEVMEFMLQGDAGLQFVQIDLEMVDVGPGTQDAVYQVIEGDSVRIAQVVFEGNTVFSQRELRWALKRTNESYLLSFLNKNNRYSRAGYEADMFEIGNMYRRRGYLEMRAGDPQIVVFENEDGGQQRLAITIPIEEGPQFRIGAIGVEGNEAFSDEELLEVLDLESGDVFNLQQVRGANESIQTKYADAGYQQVAVVPQPGNTDLEAPGGPTADLIFRVAENGLYRVNRIEFEGNTNTRDFVLRRSFNLHELSRWDQSRYDTSIERLFQLGYFQDVQPELTTAPPGESPDAESPPDPNYGQVDIDVAVQEVGRNQITFGGGLSALEGGFVQFGYTTRNLFGYGQTLSLFGQIGGLRQNVRISFADPYLFGKRLRFGLDLFRDALDFPDFQREGTGFSVRLGRSLNEKETISFFTEYNYEVIDIGDVSATFGGVSSPLFEALFLTEGRRVTSSVRPFFFWADVDNPYLPTEGTRTTVSYEYAGGPMGGTLDFWKARLGTTWWIPIKRQGSGILRQNKQIFVLNVKADWAQPHGDLDEIPIFERFFLGGSQSVRGTRLRSIGPIDDRGNILGGTKSFQYNVEYVFALSPQLRVKAFHDAGQAWLSDEEIRLSEMRRTAGLEFEVFAPVFNVPFRFFWAYNFDPLEIFGEQRSTFEFAIGSTF